MSLVCRSSKILALVLASVCVGLGQDVIPPSAPTSLTATATTCGQVDLSWSASVDDMGGSGVKAYIISRSDGNSIGIGAARTTFSDTNYVRSSSSLTYTVVAMDNAGNRSPASNTAYVSTPPCSIAPGESVIDGAYMEPLGKSMATFGNRTAVIYIKLNYSTMKWETWINVNDSDTGMTSSLLLHTSPGYYQTESDYVLTSATELSTLSADQAGGHLLVSQYKLNGAPPTSATLVSTKSLGDSNSQAGSMIRLQSGALMAAWYENLDLCCAGATDLTTGFAYRSPTGTWSVKNPVTIPNSGGGSVTLSQMIMAQHPADGSIWAFVKRDSFYEIGALHFTETTDDVFIDWINPAYISNMAEGENGPQAEYPFLAAVADPTRNDILLAYQTNHYQMVFIDPMFYSSMNNIFLKQAYATVAQINADGTKTFIPFQNYMERGVQFGMSVLSDGTIWLTYQPINSQTRTWNQVYASQFQNGGWSAATFTGLNYTTYNTNSGGRNPGLLIYRTDQPQVAFLTPDQKIHSFTLSGSAPPPPSPDTTAPTASLTNPLGGAIVTGTVNISAAASDNIGVNRVDLLVDGAVQGTAGVAPYNFSWDTRVAAVGNHTLQAVAYDAAGNKGNSTVVTVMVDNTIPTVAITTPANGATVPRNTTQTISATASDGSGIKKVDFWVDGKLTCTASIAPYTCSWKVPPKSNASHTIQVVASNLANVTSSATSKVTAK